MIRTSSRTMLRASVAALAVTMVALVAGPATASSAASHRPKSGTALVNASFAASKSARSVRITGTISSAGTGQSIVIDSTVLHNGNGYGTVTVQGQTLKVVQIGATNYFKAGKSYWSKVFGSKNAIAVPIYANHWIRSSGAQTPEAGLRVYVNMVDLLSGFDFASATWVRAGTTTFGGQRVYVVHGTQHGMTGTLLIAATGPPYLKAIEPPQGQGGLVFNDWNKAVRIHAPSGSIDFNSLGGSGGPS